MKKTHTSPLNQVLVTVPLDAEDAAAELLTRTFGTPASSYYSEKTRLSTVSVYLDPKTNVTRAEAALRKGFHELKDFGVLGKIPRIRIKSLPPQDWAESWKSHFKPFIAARTFLVKPSWVTTKPAKGILEIVLDPGLSFGTGHHPTTRFCLEQIAMLTKDGTPKSLLDLGTGSGILAIGAAKRGCRPIRAVDYDPVAVDVAKENAEHNGVGEHIVFARGDVTKINPHAPRRRTYDIVCANILAVVLEAEAIKIASQVKPGGHLLAAGILTAQFPGVEAAFRAAGLRCIGTLTRKEWTSGVFQLP